MGRLPAIRTAMLLFLTASSSFFAPAAFAVEAGQAAYTGGTLSLAQGVAGSFDTGPSASLVFRCAAAGSVSNVVDIPYKAITFFEYKTEVAHHIGVLPAVAVSLVKRRERKHLFTISFTDFASNTQVGVFEVSKHDAQSFLQILRARAPQACRSPRASCSNAPAQPLRSPPRPTME